MLNPKNKNKKCAPIKYQSAAIIKHHSTANSIDQKGQRVTQSHCGLLEQYFLKMSYETSIRPFRETNTCKDIIFYE